VLARSTTNTQCREAVLRITVLLDVRDVLPPAVS
jgi:hypothetical protein